VEVAREPDYGWGDGFQSFMTEADGTPVVRLAVTNCRPDTDIWAGLRSPSLVGMYPIGLPDIWRHYAAANVKSTRYDGSPNPLAMPEPFEEALERYPRAVIISGMLVMNPQIYDSYAEKIAAGDLDPVDYYGRARGEVSGLINKALGKLALSLMSPDRAVIPMTGKNVGTIIDRCRSEYYKGRYHGPCNNCYPQNSVAVLTGLLRFGVSRLPFRDEVGPDGEVRRLFGQYASIVLFDGEEPVTDGAEGISLLDKDRLSRLRRVNNYTDVAPEVVAQRYCTYNLTRADGTSVCGKCIEVCPAGALANSSPGPDGTYDERLLRQKHRFFEGVLDFDAGNCIRDRGQKSQLHEDYVCARCAAVCAALGMRRSAADIERING